jgi:hypothetical protein
MRHLDHERFDDGCNHTPGDTDDQDRTSLGYRPARTHVDELKRLLAARGLTLDLCWRWNRRCRDGVLTLHDAQGQTLFERQFERNTQRWVRSDETLQCVRTGSPRHRAVVAALEHVLGMQ